LVVVIIVVEVVDEAVSASEHLRGRNLPRAAAGGVNQTYSRTRKHARGSNPLLHKQMINLILMKKCNEMDTMLMQLQLQHLLNIQLKMEETLKFELADDMLI
jgi:hypothetical protein